MKKIYISADVEGLNGVTSFKQVLPEFSGDYAQMLPQLHLELNALIKGLKKAGIKKILINDAHNTMTNISLTNLPDDIELISGKPKEISMMYGLDESFDGVILFAYHAKATSNGVLAHTFNPNFKSVSINDEKISEAQLNATIAKIKKVPIILASGDDVFCEEIRKDIGEVTTIETKKSINNTAAICKQNKVLLSEYEQIASKIKTLEKIHYKLSQNYELKVEFQNQETAQIISETTKLSQQNNCIVVSSTDFMEIYKTLQKISAETTVLQRNQIQQV